METDEKMTLRDLPVDTRNYTIIDNVTGKPIEQSNYSLTIDQDVITKLNKLKRVNEEKIKQASLKNQYGSDALVETFTPEDNSVFTPLYNGEYIDARDFREESVKVEEVVEEVVEEQKVEEPTTTPIEVIQSNTLPDRVIARSKPAPQPETPSEEPTAAEPFQMETTAQPQENYQAEQGETAPAQDNSLFTPEMVGLQAASEQIVKIDEKKLGPAIKPPKAEKPGREKIKLEKTEILAGKKVAWFAYLLFFLPLLFKGRNRFVKLHANEGLKLNLMEIIGAGLLLPFFLMKEATGNTLLIIQVCGLIGLAILAACAITILPMMLVAMCGGQFQIPWLWKKRIIRVKLERDQND